MSKIKSPLARLVRFIICLAIAGSVVAGAHYFSVDLPYQDAALHPPINDNQGSDFTPGIYIGIQGGYADSGMAASEK